MTPSGLGFRKIVLAALCEVGQGQHRVRGSLEAKGAIQS